MSDDVSQLDFERMRDILLSLLMKMEISRSNCPTGARVATVSYSSGTNYLVRLSDRKGRPALLQAVRGLSPAGSSGSRHLGDAVRFVARHVFKRVRAGPLLRKVAVFFQAGWTWDAGSISTAMLELSLLDITSVVITFTEDHNLPDALLVNQCLPAPECGQGTPRPLQVDVDIAFVVDGSRGMGADLYRAALTLVDAVLEELEVARQPSASPRGARVALRGRAPVLEGFHLTAYGHRTQMQRSVCEAVGHPLRGAPTLGHALEWPLEKVLLAAPLLWRAQVLFAIVASETSSWDREKLRTLSLEAKCKGITLFVLALGPGVGTRELAELVHVASSPWEQHLLRLEGVSEVEVTYALGFTWAFLNLLKTEQMGMPGGTNQYPPPELTEQLPKRQCGKSGFTDDLKALEAKDSFQEEDREAAMMSITQQEALENYEKSGYDAEENHQKDPAKLKKTGKERSPGNVYGWLGGDHRVNRKPLEPNGESSAQVAAVTSVQQIKVALGF
ncbi:hypothetical protein Celaphus_00012784 [Cervus elaphus hippelaphus]|uniref:VWFA domain-containing protein n=1 Tax=Cervus elaphus hippelaphus TaxID=46360 RepID=A0A212CJ90_CEREH|nr:hypothetical protein Celaphus_00012784 [Cervus elaphus hippelaphus]